MSILRILAWLYGHVTLIVKGRTLERFINMATSRGISFWDIRRLDEERIMIRTRIGGVRPLRHIARRTGSRFEISERVGFPFVLARLWRRKTLAMGLALFLVGLYTMASFVWFIDVKGNRTVSEAQIIRAARQAGLHPGVPKWGVEASRVEARIREQLPALAWVGVRLRGTQAVIEVAEKKLPSPDPAGIHSNIVAAKAGLVKEVLVLSGEAVVKEGETVVPGQLLISGEIWPPEGISAEGEILPGEPRRVRARGIVRARVWYEEYGEAPLVDEGTSLTGRQARAWEVKVGGRVMHISGPGRAPYKDYEQTVAAYRAPSWRSFSLPVELYSRTYREIKPYRRTRPYTEALRLARREARETLDAALAGTEVKVLNRRMEIINPGKQESLVRVRLTMEVLEDIGRERLVEP
ncbi:MAG: sporulation protein YqfD [Bacillota bacterium]|nr:sporulation protein YqfD [Bacillota bacterium]